MAPAGLAVREDEWKIVTELVLDGISSRHTRRAYSQALDEFLVWFRDEPGRQFNKAAVQKYRAELEVKGLAPSSINVRLSAIRRLALEASDNGRLDSEIAAGIARAKGAKRSGVRLGHWLTTDQARVLLAAPDLTTLKGIRDSAVYPGPPPLARPPVPLSQPDATIEFSMSRPATPVVVSPSERLILEAVVDSEQIPDAVQKRARVVLLAAEDVKIFQIGREVGMHRYRVLYWRRRFTDSGIPGLWDREGVLPRERIPEEVEREIVFDCLYRPKLSWEISRQMPDDPRIHWNVRNLARRHGVSPATIQRVWKKYGIKMVRLHLSDLGVDLEKLKISQDPLFGVSVYEIAGLFYENAGAALVLCSRKEPMGELALNSMSRESRLAMINGLVARSRQLEDRNFGRAEPAVERFVEFLRRIRAEPRHRDAKMHLRVRGQRSWIRRPLRMFSGWLVLLGHKRTF